MFAPAENIAGVNQGQVLVEMMATEAIIYTECRKWGYDLAEEGNFSVQPKSAGICIEIQFTERQLTVKGNQNSSLKIDWGRLSKGQEERTVTNLICVRASRKLVGNQTPISARNLRLRQNRGDPKSL